MLAGVAGVNVVGTEWVAPGLDFGEAPNVNTEQYWLIADVCLWLYAATLSFSDFPCDSNAFVP